MRRSGSVRHPSMAVQTMLAWRQYRRLLDGDACGHEHSLVTLAAARLKYERAARDEIFARRAAVL